MWTQFGTMPHNKDTVFDANAQSVFPKQRRLLDLWPLPPSSLELHLYCSPLQVNTVHDQFMDTARIHAMNTNTQRRKEQGQWEKNTSAGFASQHAGSILVSHNRHTAAALFKSRLGRFHDRLGSSPNQATQLGCPHPTSESAFGPLPQFLSVIIKPAPPRHGKGGAMSATPLAQSFQGKLSLEHK